MAGRRPSAPWRRAEPALTAREADPGAPPPSRASENDQAATLAFLATPNAHGGAGPVRRLDTHISAVFLAGDRVLKLKRAVRLGYVDFSTRERRRAAAAAEVTINRRTAPSLYLGVAPVVRGADGALALGPVVEPEMAADAAGVVDWVVVMRRFDEETLLDRFADRGALDPALARAVAEAVASFHARARRIAVADGAARVGRVLEGNAASVARAAVPRPLAPARADALLAATRAEHARRAALLDARAAAGFVRDGHGDLHLGNICLDGGRPTLFDAIEFDPAFREIDVFYDAAFLLMDLARRGLAAAANAAFNAYVAATGDLDGIATLPLFLAMRATIRGHVAATQAAERAGVAAEDLWRASADYFAFAERALAPPPPRLVAIGGLSGTGKSTVAAALAPALGAVPGALVLRSDAVRKELAGVAETTRLDDAHYTRARTAEVYAALLDRAGRALAAGQACIVDAVSGDAEHRAALAALARRHGAGFAGAWLEAPLALRQARIAARRNDASDATAEVAARQWAPETLDWPRIDATGAPEAVAARVAAAIG